MFECCGLHFSIIKPELINSFSVKGKSTTYKEHGYKLVVNKTFTRLEIPNCSHHCMSLMTKRFDVNTEEDLAQAIKICTEYQRKNILECVKSGGGVKVQLEGGVTIDAINTLDGPMWSIGRTLLSVEKYPSLDCLRNFFCLNQELDTVSYSHLNKDYLDKLLAVGYVKEIVFSVVTKSRREFDFRYNPISCILDISEDSQPFDDNRYYMGLFSVSSYQEVDRIAELFMYEVWGTLLETYVESGDYSYSKLHVLSRVTNSFDLALSLSPDPDKRGYWLVPTEHSEYGFGSERVEVDREPVWLGMIPFSDAISKAKDDYPHPKCPEFRTLCWGVVEKIATSERTWSITEHNTTLMWNGSFLTLNFFELNDYPDSISICCDQGFDAALESAWKLHSGYLKTQ